MIECRLAKDSDLLVAIAKGQDAVLAVLYDRYHGQAFAFALRILAAEPDAEEAVQETFVRIWRSAAQYDPSRAAVLSWLLSITRNLCLDELRRRRRRAPELQELEDAMGHPSEDRTDLAAERAVIGEQVRAALPRSPANSAALLNWCTSMGLPAGSSATSLAYLHPPFVVGFVSDS